MFLGVASCQRQDAILAPSYFLRSIMTKKLQRRELFEKATFLACATSAGGILTSLSVAAQENRWMPLPPGALDREKFFTACSKCGQCVVACPYETLKLAGLFDPAPIGTPFFRARNIPCYMCRDIPCVKACPTGALSPQFTDIKKAQMGVAVVDPSSCLSWQGLRCEVCLRDCPVGGQAITIEMQPRGLSKHALFIPTIHPDKCTGCGLCEKGCPTEEPAIKIVDRKAVLGQIGQHYRLGWLDENDPKNQRTTTIDSTRILPESEVPGGLDFLNENIIE